MNLPIRIPASTEAAAMGGAIQALWCLLNNSSEKNRKNVSIKDLAEEHVVLESSASRDAAVSKDIAASKDAVITPDKKAVAAYNKAYTEYSRYLGALSPLYK
jgi:xylulokinase